MSPDTMQAQAIDGWAFRWLPDDIAMPTFQLSVRLRWQGTTLSLAVDGLAGLDGRLDAPALQTLPDHLRPVVLGHFAEQVLRTSRAALLSALGGMTLQSLQWHETPMAMADGWPFVLRAPGVMGCSVGRLQVLDALGRADAAAQAHLVAALAAAGAPLPEAHAHIAGRLQIARLHLAREELATLDSGDWVWLPDAEITPRGLRVQFRPEGGGPGCEAWLRRGRLQRGESLADAVAPAGPDDAAGLLPLTVVGPVLGVARGWWHGAQTGLTLPGSVAGERWVAMAGALPWFEGRLQLHGRRLALQVTQVLHPAARTPTARTTTTTAVT